MLFTPSRCAIFVVFAAAVSLTAALPTHRGPNAAAPLHTPALNFLLTAVGSNEIAKFFSETLEKESRVFAAARNDDDGRGRIFSLAALDDLLPRVVSAVDPGATAMLSRVDCSLVTRVKRDGEWWSGAWPGDSFNESAVRSAFGKGFTVVINKMDSRVSNLGVLAANLERELGSSVQANMYLTPPGAQGFEHHFDPMETFVLQMEGHKRWRVFGSLIELPRLEQRFKPNISQVESLNLVHDVEVKPGDLLYMPRGVIHEAIASRKGPSMHITVGIDLHFSTWEAVAHFAVSPIILREFGRADLVVEAGSCEIPWRVLLHMAIWRAANDNVELRRVYPLTPVLIRGIGGVQEVHKAWQQVLNLVKGVKFEQALEDAITYLSQSPRKHDALVSMHVDDVTTPSPSRCSSLPKKIHSAFESLKTALSEHADLKAASDAFAETAKERLARIQKARNASLVRHKQREVPG